MRNYKLIINFNSEKEQNIYFDKLVVGKLKLLTGEYILSSYQSTVGSYIVLDYNLNENNKKVFNSCPARYLK